MLSRHVNPPPHPDRSEQQFPGEFQSESHLILLGSLLRKWKFLHTRAKAERFDGLSGYKVLRDQ